MQFGVGCNYCAKIVQVLGWGGKKLNKCRFLCWLLCSASCAKRHLIRWPLFHTEQGKNLRYVSVYPSIASPLFALNLYLFPVFLEIARLLRTRHNFLPHFYCLLEKSFWEQKWYWFILFAAFYPTILPKSTQNSLQKCKYRNADWISLIQSSWD